MAIDGCAVLAAESVVEFLYATLGRIAFLARTPWLRATRFAYPSSSVGAATAFFFVLLSSSALLPPLFVKSGTTASGICGGTGTYMPWQLYTAELLFVCLPTNIEISSFIFNITGANARRDATRHNAMRARKYTHAYTWESASSRSCSPSTGSDSKRRRGGWNRRMKRGDEFARTAR